MRRLRHLLLLLKTLLRYSAVNDVWWPIPMVITLLLVIVLAIAGQTAAPFIYTLF
jgi:hypothetical protein